MEFLLIVIVMIDSVRLWSIDLVSTLQPLSSASQEKGLSTIAVVTMIKRVIREEKEETEKLSI